MREALKTLSLVGTAHPTDYDWIPASAGMTEEVQRFVPAGSPRVSLGPLLLLPQDWGTKGVEWGVESVEDRGTLSQGGRA